MDITDSEIRRKKIFAILVESYIENARPVSSRLVSHKFRSTLSPATVRNVMADLEEMGLITHTHTSAGRIPTDKGYRDYVDSLTEVEGLTIQEEETIRSAFRSEECPIEEFVEDAVRVLALITHQAGIFLFPRLASDIFKHIELIPLTARRILVIFITGSGLVRDSILETNEDLDKEALPRISNWLNNVLEDMPIDEINRFIFKRALEEEDMLLYNARKFMGQFEIEPLFEGDDRLYLDGASNILEQPEFSDSKQRLALLKAMERKDALLKTLTKDISGEGVKVRIGMENEDEEIRSCSLITKNYKVYGRNLGTFGIIGPTRMAYGKLISIVDFMGRLVEDFFNANFRR